jgi:hypothetical protein
MNIEEIVSNYSMNAGTMQKPKMYSSNNLEELTSMPQYMGEEAPKKVDAKYENGIFETIAVYPDFTLKTYTNFKESTLGVKVDMAGETHKECPDIVQNASSIFTDKIYNPKNAYGS